MTDYYGKIVIFTSSPFGLKMGNGKTLSMIRKAFFDKLKGRVIYSNLSFSFADKYFELEELENILEGKNGIILIDELHSLISCYDSPKSKRKLVSISRQIRKRNFNLYITAQVLNDIPAFIRRLAPEIIICKKLHYDLTECFNPECKEEHLFLNKSLEGSMIIFEPHLTLKINSKYVKIKNFFFNIYDTHEIIKFVDIKKRRN